MLETAGRVTVGFCYSLLASVFSCAGRRRIRRWINPANPVPSRSIDEGSGVVAESGSDWHKLQKLVTEWDGSVGESDG